MSTTSCTATLLMVLWRNGLLLATSSVAHWLAITRRGRVLFRWRPRPPPLLFFSRVWGERTCCMHSILLTVQLLYLCVPHFAESGASVYYKLFSLQVYDIRRKKRRRRVIRKCSIAQSVSPPWGDGLHRVGLDERRGREAAAIAAASNSASLTSKSRPFYPSSSRKGMRRGEQREVAACVIQYYGLT